MAQKRQGVLLADPEGFFHLYEADLGGCWHYESPCDGQCAVAGQAVAGFAPTNAYGPAAVRAARLGYDILDV